MFFYDYFLANIPIFFLPVLCLFHLLDDLCLRTVCGLVGPFGYLCLFVLATEFLLLLFVCCFYCCLFVVIVVFFDQHFNEVFSSAFRFYPLLSFYSLGDDEVDQAGMGLKEPFRGNSIFFSFQFCVSYSIPADLLLGGGG